MHLSAPLYSAHAPYFLRYADQGAAAAQQGVAVKRARSAGREKCLGCLMMMMIMMMMMT